MQSDQGILYIEPSSSPAQEPLIDGLTMLMAGALRSGIRGIGTSKNFRPGSGYRGRHTCSCGVMSGNCELQLGNGEVTNSLATHYLAWHRDEISEEQLNKVRALAGIATPVEPNDHEIGFPHR